MKSLNLQTKYDSYCLNNLPKGCQYCVKGQKSVLFISGICSRNCIYCSLSEKRKNKDIIYCNETICKSPSQAIKEIKQSNSKGIGITGGDPLVCLNRTLLFAKAIKKQFEKNNKHFHIHIYLPTKLITKNNLSKISKYIDEVRFHPEFLINPNQSKQERQSDIDKIKLASLFWKKNSIGVELPMIPDKKQDILDFIKEISPFIGFVNLNEFEISETNFDYITKKYALNKDSYTISQSANAGLWILNQCKKEKSKLKLNVHFCTAQLKNIHQFKNRLKLHNILPFGKRTSDGTVIYLAIYNNANQAKKYLIKNKFKSYYLDKNKNRIILSELLAKKLLKLTKPKFKIERVEEFPTSDKIEVEREEINL